jgi:hypothetical protein
MPVVFIVPIAVITMTAFSIANMMGKEFEEAKLVAIVTFGVQLVLAAAIIIYGMRSGPSKKKRQAGPF